MATPADYQAVNNAEGNTFGSDNAQVDQSPDQQKKNRIIGDLADPFNQMNNNWGRMTGDYKDGHIMAGLFDTYNMAKNPTGNWGQREQAAMNPQQQSQSTQQPTFQAHHFGEQDKNGISPFSDTGKQYIAQGAGMSDNSGLINQFHGSGHTSASLNAAPKGLIGNAFQKFKGMLSSQDQSQQFANQSQDQQNQ